MDNKAFVFVDKDLDIEYVVKFDANNAYISVFENTTLNFTALIEYAAINARLHGIIENKMVDHVIPYNVWCDIRKYLDKPDVNYEEYNKITNSKDMVCFDKNLKIYFDK